MNALQLSSLSALLLASVASAQITQRFTGSLPTRSVRPPAYTTNGPESYTTRISFDVPRFSPSRGILQAVEIRSVNTTGLSFTGTLAASQPSATPVTADCRAVWTVTAPNATTATGDRVFNGSDSIAAGQTQSSISYPSQGLTLINTVPVQDLCSFVGFGTVRIRLSAEFLQEANWSAPTGMNWQYSPTIASNITVTYTYSFGSSQTASVTAVGTGCASGGGTPALAWRGRPEVGETSFFLDLTSAPANAAQALLFSPMQGSLPVGPGCTLLVGTPLFDIAATPTDTNGGASTNVLVPADPGLIGLTLFVQSAIVETGGPAFGVVTLSNALQLDIGC